MWTLTDLSRVYDFNIVRAFDSAGVSQILMLFGRLYGVTLGQWICYAHWFPSDPWHTKAFVRAFVLSSLCI